MERLAVPHTRARSALASRRGPDRVLIACGNQAGLFAVFFALRGRGLPCDPLKTLPRNVRLSPLPKLHAPVRKFESAGIVPSHRGSGRHLGYNTEHCGQSMSAEIKSHLTELLTRALAKVAPQQPGSLISLERPKQAQHGDFSCPAAMQLARALKRNPRELALELVAALPPSEWLERAEVAGGGFINLRVRPAAKQHIVQTILAEGDRYGRADRAGGRPVMVEFVSANPTAPLHVWHGRQAAFGVRFDSYYLESSLYRDGRVQKTVQALIDAGKTFEQDGALWLKTTEYGDDKDRVMRKSDGTYTYFVPDVAYHLAKWERGFIRAINIQGSDHHGTVTRVRAGLQAASSKWERAVPQGYPDYVLHKMVTVMKGGEEMKISKRAGSYVTLRELIDEVGRDAVRFFLLSRKADADFVFDIDLAKSQSEENPVYYVQYAHARICSVLEQWRTQFGGEDGAFAATGALNSANLDSLRNVDLGPLGGARELALLQRLGEYAEILENAAAELAPHQIVFYLRELAGEFHSYYNAERILVAEAPLRSARLGLCLAVRQVLRNGLSLLGVSQPEKM